MTLHKINIGFLFSLVGFLFFCLYKLFVSEEIYPYTILLFISILSIGIYFPIYLLRYVERRVYNILSFFGLFNIIILFLDYFFPILLRNTWNFSFAFILFFIFYGLITLIKKMETIITTLTYWSTVITGFLISSALVLKLTSTIFYSIATYSFLISGILILSTFVLFYKKSSQ